MAELMLHLYAYEICFTVTPQNEMMLQFLLQTFNQEQILSLYHSSRLQVIGLSSKWDSVEAIMLPNQEGFRALS